MKVINPLENFDGSKLEKLEKINDDFYSLANNVDMSKLKNLSKFQEADLDLDLIDGKEIDLMKLLDIEDA